MSATTKAGRWLTREPDPDAAARLFCLPVSGIGATLFRPWPPRIDDIEVCPVQLPGRENRAKEPACASMEEFTKQAADALEPYLDRPFAFYGHCYGARLGYALSVELASRGLPLPRHLFASACLAPHRGGYFGGGRSGPFTPETTDEEYFAELRHGCEVRGEPVPPDELLAIATRVLRADTLVTCGYQPEGPAGPPLDITTIVWSEDEHVHPDDMDEWEPYGTVRRVSLEGDDFTHRSGPPELLRVISEGFVR